MPLSTPGRSSQGSPKTYAAAYADQIEVGKSEQYAAAYAGKRDGGKPDDFAATYARQIEKGKSPDAADAYAFVFFEQREQGKVHRVLRLLRRSAVAGQVVRLCEQLRLGARIGRV